MFSKKIPWFCKLALRAQTVQNRTGIFSSTKLLLSTAPAEPPSTIPPPLPYAQYKKSIYLCFGKEYLERLKKQYLLVNFIFPENI